VSRYPESEFLEIEADMNDQFTRFGTVIYCRMVRPSEAKMGAEAGCVLIEFANPECADQAKLRM